MNLSKSDFKKMKKIDEDFNCKIKEIEIKPCDKWDYVNDKIQLFRKTAVGTLEELEKKENLLRIKYNEEYDKNFKDLEKKIADLKKEKKEKLFKCSCWKDQKNGKEVFFWLWDKAEYKVKYEWESNDYPCLDTVFFYKDIEEDFVEGLLIFLNGNNNN